MALRGPRALRSGALRVWCSLCCNTHTAVRMLHHTALRMCARARARVGPGEFRLYRNTHTDALCVLVDRALFAARADLGAHQNELHTPWPRSLAT